MQKIIAPSIIRQIFVLLLICTLGALIFREMAPYLSGVLGAITFLVLLQKPMNYLVNKGWKPSWAASMLLFLSFIGVLIPVSAAILLVGNRVEKGISKSEVFIQSIKDHVATWEKELGYEFTSNIDASSVSSWLSENVPDFIGSTTNMIISIIMMYVLLYYMLSNRKSLQKVLLDYIPINNNSLRDIGGQSLSLVKANAIGIPLVALGQAIVALIGFLIFKIEDPFFWTVIVFVGSMIPYVGTVIGIIPVFVLSLINGNDSQAWGIFIYGILVVGSTDNLMRLFILKRLDDVPPLITLIGVLVGIPLFGFIGLVFGPLLISLFLIVLRIYKEKYGHEDNSKEGKRL